MRLRRKPLLDPERDIFAPVPFRKRGWFAKLWFRVFTTYALVIGVWDILRQQWWFAAFQGLVVVLMVTSNEYAKRAERGQTKMQRKAMLVSDDFRSKALNGYFEMVARYGEVFAYTVMDEVYNEATLRGLGIYKTKAELTELRWREEFL